MFRIYNACNKFLYEIIEDYKFSQLEQEKNDILKVFFSLIWSCDNKRRVYEKTISYKVNKNLINTDIGQLFDKYSSIKYTTYKRMSKEQDAITLIRQKINNIYTNMFDENVCLKKDYMDCIKKAKELYFLYINGAEMTYDFIKSEIESNLHQADTLKDKYGKQKMKLEWKEYRVVVEGYLKKIFDNCRLLQDYEDKNHLTLDIDTWNEDNFYVGYICKYLNNAIKEYQRYYYGIKQRGKKTRCESCGKLINIKNKFDYSTKYCDECKTIINKTKTNERVRKYRNNKMINTMDNDEIWKQTGLLDGNYFISSKGRVKNKKTNKITNGYKTLNGYMQTEVTNGEIRKKVYIHRLVAIAFIPNLNNLPQVNHIDENKLNNNMSNLEWVTEKYNSNHGTRTIRSSRNRYKKVIQFDLSNNILNTYNSVTEASKLTKISQPQISNCCNGKAKTAGGYMWCYECNDSINSNNP